jgi:hypothetical protein
MITRVLAALSLCASSAVATDPVFEVSFDPSVRDAAASGRLVVYLIADTSRENRNQEPGDAPFFEDPQPMFGIEVKRLAPGTPAVVDGAATAFPVSLSNLPAGVYRVQAVLDMHRDDSSWKREPGNLFSETVTLRLNEVDAPERHSIKLTKVVRPRKFPATPGVEEFTIRSKLLSEFHKRDIMLAAGVRLPSGYKPDADTRYPAVYEVPGFGGDHFDAAGWRPGTAMPGCFSIVLNPESGNGHTLFADSANNGPCGEALVEELIPALEAKYKLIAAPSARLLRGHSSGGWSTLWLAITYPGTFGATWSTSPDPVDFRRFQTPDIYSQANMFIDAQGAARGGKEITSYRSGGRELMTIRQENLMEEVIGPDNTSGQQWDSWFAAFGPRNERGNPAPLFELDGGINKEVAEQYRRYDIADLLRKDTARYAPLFRERVRLVVGDQDNYYLNDAVSLLKSDLDKITPTGPAETRHGYIKIVPGRDHGTIFMTPELQGIQGEMIAHLKRNGHMQK